MSPPEAPQVSATRSKAPQSHPHVAPALTVLAEVQLGEASSLEGLLKDGAILPLAEGVKVHGFVLHPGGAEQACEMVLSGCGVP